VRLAGPFGRYPALAGRSEGESAATLAHEGEAVRLVDSAAAEGEPDALEPAQERRRIADDPKLREADGLLRGETAAASGLLDPAVGDELEDVAGPAGRPRRISREELLE
jgi:hypothetical protein